MSIKSMTGYGKGQIIENNRKLIVEIKSVNHRFLDLSIKSPRQFMFAEECLRAIIKNSNIKRGHLDVFIQYEDNREDKNNIKIDYNIAKEYVEAANEISKKFGLPNENDSIKILTMRDVLTFEENEDDDAVLKFLLEKATQEALKSIIQARIKEGVELEIDLLCKLNEVKNLVEKINKLSNDDIAQQIEKLKQKIQGYLGDISIDKDRLMNEIVFYSDKVGVDEEITRLKSHIKSFVDDISDSKDEAIGKKLDFIVQEMNRETNTIGSKASKVEITRIVVELKMIIEKIREQIQNIE